MPEIDEYGIPVKSNVQFDEYGIPLKKKEETESAPLQSSGDFVKAAPKLVEPSQKNGLEQLNYPQENVTQPKEENSLASNIASSFDRGMTEVIPSALESVGAVTNQIDKGLGKITGNEGSGFENQPATKLANKVREGMDYLFPVDNEFKQSYAGQIAQGLGQVGGMALTMPLGVVNSSLQSAKTAIPIVSVGKELAKTMTSTAAKMAAPQVFASEYKQAKEGGADDETAFGVGLVNMIGGTALEALPIANAFKRLDKISEGQIKKAFLNTAKGTIEEASTEAIQQVFSNLTAQGTYDKNREIINGVGDAAGIGGSTGFILNATLNALGLKLKATKIKSEQQIIEQSIVETQQVINETNQQDGATPKANVTDIENRNTITEHSPEATQTLVSTSIENSPQIVSERLSQNANEPISEPTSTEPITNDGAIEGENTSLPSAVQAPIDQTENDNVNATENATNPINNAKNKTKPPTSKKGVVDNGSETSAIVSQKPDAPLVKENDGGNSVGGEVERNWKVQGRTVSNSKVGGKISEADAKKIIKQIVEHPLNKYDNLQFNYNKENGTISFFGDKDLVNSINEDIGNKSVQKIKIQQETDVINKAKAEKEKSQLDYINSKKSESGWVDNLFGKDVLGNFNKIELIKYLSGESDKFGGSLSRQTQEGLNKIDAIKDGKVDFKKLKTEYEQSLKEQPKAEQVKPDAPLVGKEGNGINVQENSETTIINEDKNETEVGEGKQSEFSEFEAVVNDSKTDEEAFENVKNMQGVSRETSTAFRDKYDPNRELSTKEAFSKFYNEIKDSRKSQNETSNTNPIGVPLDNNELIAKIKKGETKAKKQEILNTEFINRSKNQKIIAANETQKINQDFQLVQNELAKDMDVSDLKEEQTFDNVNTIFDKATNGEQITDTEVKYLNENAYRMDGYSFDNTASLIKNIEPIKQVVKPKGKDAIAEGLAMFARVSGTTKNIIANEGDSYASAVKLIAEGIVDKLGYSGQKLIDAVKKYLSDAGVDKKEIESVVSEHEDVINKVNPDPVSKWQKTFRGFTKTFDPKEELRTYKSMTGESLSNDAAKLIEDKSPEYVFNALQSIADNKPIAITEDERVHLVAAGALIAQALDTESRTLLQNNELEKAQDALDTRNKIVENISYLGTKSGQLIKALDLKWLSSFSDPQSVLDAFAKGLSKHILENLDSKSGKVKTYEKVIAKTEKLIAKAKEKSKTDKVGTKKTEGEKKEKDTSTHSGLRGKTKLYGKDLIADATENLVSLFGGIKMLDGAQRISAVKELTRVGVGLIDIAAQKGIDITSSIHDKIREHLEKTFGNSKIYDSLENDVNDALFPKTPEEKKIENLEKQLADLIKNGLKEPKKKTEDSPKVKELKAKIREQKELLQAAKDKKKIADVKNDVETISNDVDKARKESEANTKEFQQKINRLIETDKEFQILHKELMEDLKELGAKDDKNLNKKAREILALIYLNEKDTKGFVQSAIATAINAKNTINPQSIVQANLLAKKAASYPANSIKRSTLMGQAIQTIANSQPIDYMQLILTANYAQMLSRPFTYYSIVESSLIEKQALKNRFSRIPFLGDFTEKAKFIREISANEMLGNLAKANLMNSMINGDIRLNSMFSKSIDKNSLSNFMQSNPLERLGGYGKLLNAPLRIMGTLDAYFTPSMDKANEATLVFTSLRLDPINKGKTDTELLAEVKQGLKIFDQIAIDNAEAQATKEGFKKGKLPSSGRMAKNYGNVAIGKSDVAFTQDERDAMDYHIRLNEILEEKKDLDILDQAENLTNKGLMRVGRRFTIDKGDGKTKEVSSPTTYVYEKLEEFNKYLEELVSQSSGLGKGVYVGARLLSNVTAPFMKTVMVMTSRTTDSTPGIGLAKYFIHKGTVGKSINPENILELQKILHRQFRGAITMGVGLGLQYLLHPSDDEEERKKEGLTFAITGQLTGLDKSTKNEYMNKIGKQQMVVMYNGDVKFQLGYQNWDIKTVLDANAAIVGFMRSKDEIVEKEGEEWYNDSLSNVGIYIASIGSSLFSSTYNKSMSEFYDALLQSAIEQDGSAISKNAIKSFGNIPSSIVSMGVPYSGLLKNVEAMLYRFKPAKDVSSQMWQSLPMGRAIGLVKPQLDMFGDPITAYPAEGSNPLTPNLKAHFPAYVPTEREKIMRDHLLFNHAIPNQIKTNQVAINGETYEIDTEKLIFNTTKKFKDKVYNYKNDEGELMYDKIMGRKGEKLRSYIDAHFKVILNRERIKLGKQAQEENKK